MMEYKIKIQSKVISIRLVILSMLIICNIHGKSMVDTIIVESVNYKAVSIFDWSRKTKNERFEMIYKDMNPFDESNGYSRLLIISKINGDTVNMPCIPLTAIKIFEEKELIVGLSNINELNPYNIVIINLKGEVVFKREIVSIFVKLDKNEFYQFKEQYPSLFMTLNVRNRIHRENDTFFINPNGRKYYRNDTLGFAYLLTKVSWNKYFPGLGPATGQVVTWGNFYAEESEDPIKDVIVKDGQLMFLLIERDRDGFIVKLPLAERFH